MRNTINALVIGFAVASTALVTGCASVTPREAGIAAGTAAYLGYTHVALRKDDEFKKQVADIWAEVNRIETVGDLVASTASLTAKFDKVLENENLTEADKAVLLRLKSLLLSKVAEIIDSKVSTNASAVEFLAGVRQGVNEMIALEAPAESK